MSDILFIHGMWSTPAVFHRLRARLEAAGHVTHAPALPFHDRLATENPHPELAVTGVRDYVEHVVAAVATLPVVPVIAGHSLGGFLAQAVAARVSPPGLVLLAPAATATTNAFSVATLRTLSRVTTRPGWWRSPTRLDREHAMWGVFNGVPAEVAAAEFDRQVWDSGRVLRQLAFPYGADSPARIDHAGIVCPALIVVGADDRITPAAIARQTARRLPGPVDYHELRDVGHWLFHDPVLDRVAGLIGDWLPPA